MEKKIIIVCAWCKRVKGENGYFSINPYELKKLEDSGVLISHGICPKCSAKLKTNFNGKEDNK